MDAKTLMKLSLMGLLAFSFAATEVYAQEEDDDTEEVAPKKKKSKKIVVQKTKDIDDCCTILSHLCSTNM